MEYTEEFSAMGTQEALAACTPLPPRLSLQHVSSTRKTRAEAARSKLPLHGCIGVVFGCLVVYALRAIGASSAMAWTAGTVALLAWPAWRYWQQVSDPTQLFEQDDWIDFTQRRWHSRKTYTDASLAPVADSIPLDDLMLFCIGCFDAHGWLNDVSLCKVSAFDPASDQLPEWLETVHLGRSEEETRIFATAIAQCWGIPCWQRSGAFDGSSKRLC